MTTGYAPAHGAVTDSNDSESNDRNSHRWHSDDDQQRQAGEQQHSRQNLSRRNPITEPATSETPDPVADPHHTCAKGDLLGRCAERAHDSGGVTEHHHAGESAEKEPEPERPEKAFTLDHGAVARYRARSLDVDSRDAE